MRAIILAGGKATRLRPITNDLPKCLLPIKNKTILDRQIESLSELGITEIVVVTGFKSELLVQHVRINHADKNIVFVHNNKYEETGPAYGLWTARALFDDDVLYLNGDLICDKQIIRRLIECEHGSVTAVSRGVWDQEQVKVAVTAGHARALSKKIPSNESYGEFTGATKLSKSFMGKLRLVLEGYVQRGELKKFAAESISDTIQIHGCELAVLDVTGFRSIEVDTIDDFRKAKKMWSVRQLKRLGTAAKIIAASFVHALSFLMPRNRRKWVFIGWHQEKDREIFADNSKYLFLYCSHNHRHVIRPIWISRNETLPSMLNPAYEAYSVRSWKGIWHSLTAGYTFIDAMPYRENWSYSGGTKLVQLWHGKGMKKTGHDGNYSLKRYSRFLFPHLFARYHKIVASSRHTANLMMRTFKAELADIIISGLPRNDALFHRVQGAEIDTDKNYEATLKELEGRTDRVIAYMPTFRPDGHSPLDQINLETLDEFLCRQNWGMAITLHPKFSIAHHSAPHDLKNIKILQAGFDIYPLLHRVDMLITDYSSVYVDFLLLDRPMVFYTYDRERYRNENGLYSDFDDLTPGPHPKTFDELVSALSETDHYASERKRAIHILHKHKDGDASKRVTESILAEIS